jgi:hypothetical protein
VLGELLTELENYRAAHEAAIATPHGKTFLVFSTEFYQGERKRLVGGFADRLKGMLSCALLSILTDRTFLVDWQSPVDISEYFGAPKVAWNCVDVAAQFRDAFVVDAIDNDNYTVFDRYISDNGDLHAIFDGKPLARIHLNILAIGALLQKKDFLQQTSFGRTLCRLADEFSVDMIERELVPVLFAYLLSYCPQRHAVEIWDDFRNRRRAGPIIGVHFRSGGDGAWWDVSLDDIENASAINGAIARIAKQYFESKVQVLIASDSLKFRARLTEMVSPHYPVHSYTGEIYHYERSGGEALAGVDFALVEFMCLSRCDYVIHGNGGFGSTAARVGAKPFSAYGLVP